MVITKTPYRISFFGGGTDFPIYYNEHSGIAISTTINKYCYIIIRELPPYFDHRYRLRYGKTEMVNSTPEIDHPSIRACLQFAKYTGSIEVVHTGDIPAMSGVGSSSAFTVGMLLGIRSLQNRKITKKELAGEAIHIEQNVIGENVGSQDQIAAAYGGFNQITFRRNDISVESVPISVEQIHHLEQRLMLFFTGLSRNSSHIAEEQIQRTSELSQPLGKMYEFAQEALNILNGPFARLDDFGALLHESWSIKRNLSSQITTPYIDELYETASRAGALGGKLCGAGGGGFLMLYVPPERQPAVHLALKHLLYVPFHFEKTGAQVIYKA